MNARTNFCDGFTRYTRTTGFVLLLLATTVGVCLAQQQTTSRRLRTPRASGLKTIQLPEPSTSSSVSLEAALTAQQAVEPPSNQRLGFPDIGQIAWAARSAVPSLSGAARREQPYGNNARVLRPGQVFAYDGFFSWQRKDGSTKTISVEEMAVIDERGASYLIEPQNEWVLISTN